MLYLAAYTRFHRGRHFAQPLPRSRRPRRPGHTGSRCPTFQVAGDRERLVLWVAFPLPSFPVPPRDDFDRAQRPNTDFYAFDYIRILPVTGESVSRSPRVVAQQRQLAGIFGTGMHVPLPARPVAQLLNDENCAIA